jgi:hypothetical protein
MTIVKCKVCSKEFYGKPYFLKIGHAKYCSPACQHKARKNGQNLSCEICGKKTYKQVKQLKKSLSGKFFCSKSCQTIWRNQEFVGVKHHNWKNGLSAYRSVLSRNKIPKFCTLCTTKDARVLATHHIDKIRTNNHVSNLALLCHSCHFLVHHYKAETLKFNKNLSVYRLRRKSS